MELFLVGVLTLALIACCALPLLIGLLSRRD